MSELCAGLPEVPAELIETWVRTGGPVPLSYQVARLTIARQAIAWAAPTLRQQGADAELEAMLAELKAMHLPDGYADRLRAARRPKPPSLAEQATTELDRAVMRGDCVATTDAMPAIRRALQRLRELERGENTTAEVNND